MGCCTCPTNQWWYGVAGILAVWPRDAEEARLIRKAYRLFAGRVICESCCRVVDMDRLKRLRQRGLVSIGQMTLTGATMIVRRLEQRV